MTAARRPLLQVALYPGDEAEVASLRAVREATSARNDTDALRALLRAVAPLGAAETKADREAVARVLDRARTMRRTLEAERGRG